MKKISRREMLGTSGMLAGTSVMGVPVKEKIVKKKMKVIVAGAHPDDPETGCGGIMAKLADAGHEVVALYLTRGEGGIRGKSPEETAAIRTEEAHRACGILNARPVFAGQVNGDCEVTKQRYKEMFDIIQKEDPDFVLNHWPIDSHPDHRINSILVYDVWRRMKWRWAHYYFEVMSGVQSQNFQPTHFVDITDVLERKHQACFVHKSQDIEGHYEKYHGLMEKFRGMESGCRYAEAFVRHNLSPEVELP